MSITYNITFNKGDIVISKKGIHPARVTYTVYSTDNYVYGVYLHNNKSCTFVKENIILYNETETMTTQSQALYQFKLSGSQESLYGHHIGTNQQNMWVMEEKGTGKIHVIAKEDAEEVLPYTFTVKMRGNTTSFIGTPDAVKTGEVLLYTGGDYPEIATVTAVNTKNKSARSKFVGVKLVTTELLSQE